MSDAYDLYQQGRAHLRSGMPAQATVALEKAKRLEPEKASIREALGIAYFRIKRWAEAEAEFRKVLELSPADDYAHYALGRALRNQGRHDEARTHLKLARSLRPSRGSELDERPGSLALEVGDERGVAPEPPRGAGREGAPVRIGGRPRRGWRRRPRGGRAGGRRSRRRRAGSRRTPPPPCRAPPRSSAASASSASCEQLGVVLGEQARAGARRARRTGRGAGASRELLVEREVRGRGGVPGELVAGARRAPSRAAASASASSSSSRSAARQALDVPGRRRRGPRRSERRPRRGRRRRRRPPGRRRRAPAGARRTGRARPGTGRRRPSPPTGRCSSSCAAEVPEPPLGPVARGLPELVERDPRVAGDEQAGAVDGERGATASGSPLYGRITPGASTVRPSSARGGSLRKTGWGMTRSFAASTPKPASASRPRSEWTTMRSKRPNSRRQSRRRPAVRRGTRSCAVKTSGRARPEQERRRAPARRATAGGGRPRGRREEPAHPDRVLERLGRAPQPARGRCALERG